MRKIDKEKMAKGYVEMGAINLAISDDYLVIDNQAIKLWETGDAKYEMDTKNTESDSTNR